MRFLLVIADIVVLVLPVVAVTIVVRILVTAPELDQFTSFEFNYAFKFVNYITIILC